MVFGFFAVVSDGHVHAFFSQSHAGGGCQDDAFVSRAKQHVKFHAAGDDGIGVKARQLQDAIAIVEQAGIEEIRRRAAGFGDEFTKFQNLLFEGKFEKLLTKI